MTELEKCLAGEIYNCHDKIFLEFKRKARELTAKYNALQYEDKPSKMLILKKLFGGVGENVSVGSPFSCDYGRNIFINDNVSIGMNCTFQDCNKIEIGRNVLIAPNVQLYTATHPINLNERLTANWTKDSEEYFCQTYAKAIKINEGCWIGGGVIILPGVEIGFGSVIGGGSVVTKNIPANSLAVGNPCKVIRKINEVKNDGE